MAHDPSINDILLERYLAGIASDAERAQVAAWLKGDPARAAFLDHVRNSFTASAQSPDTDVSWQQLQARMTASAGTRSLREMRDKREQRSLSISAASRWQRTAWKAAAAIVLVAGAASLWNVAQRSGLGGTQSGAHVFEAPLGQTASTTLPDGTKLTIAPGSRAEWSSNYGKQSREVTLRGEGFFEVVHDATRPFRVRARDGVAEDVGTRFVVRAWPELERLEVAVEEGIVSLSDSARARRAPGTLLHAGENGRLAPDGTVQVRPHNGAAFAWMRGELAFEDAPVSEALPVLERWYAVTVHVDPALATRRVTARFTKSPLPQLLDAFALALNARVVRNGTEITLVPVKP